jgi:hypothetical protein
VGEPFRVGVCVQGRRAAIQATTRAGFRDLPDRQTRGDAARRGRRDRLRPVAARQRRPDAVEHRAGIEINAVGEPFRVGVCVQGRRAAIQATMSGPVDILSLRWEAGSGIAALDPLPMSGRSACRLLRRRPSPAAEELHDREDLQVLHFAALSATTGIRFVAKCPLTAGVFTAGQGPPVDILSLRWEAGSGIAALDPLPMATAAA